MGCILNRIDDKIDEHGSIQNYKDFKRPENIKTGNVNLFGPVPEDEDISIKLLSTLISNILNADDFPLSKIRKIKTLLKEHNLYYEGK